MRQNVPESALTFQSAFNDLVLGWDHTAAFNHLQQIDFTDKCIGKLVPDYRDHRNCHLSLLAETLVLIPLFLADQEDNVDAHTAHFVITHGRKERMCKSLV